MGAGQEGSLLFGEAAEVVGSLPAGVLMVGLTAEGEPVTVDLADREPHVLVSAPAGGGTSSLLRLLAMPAVAHGVELVVIDFRQSQHRWVRGLPGARYLRDFVDIHEALVGVAGAGPRSGRMVVVCEDLVATMAGLGQYWRDTRRPEDPPRSPAVTALGDLLVAAGRQTGVHVIAAAVRLGWPTLREEFRARFLARYSPLTWNELVPEALYRPAPSDRGWWVAALDGRVVETQAVLVTEQGARDRAAFELDPESPHLAISAGTGHGKSAALVRRLQEVMEDTDKVEVLDAKDADAASGRLEHGAVADEEGRS